MNPIITADERKNVPHGVKLLIIGQHGVGKTSLVKTIADPRSVLTLDSDCGALAIQGFPVDTIEINDWQAAVDTACRISGPNRSFSPLSCYSEAHYQKLGGALPNLDRYKIIVVDSITATSRLSLAHAEQQDEARTRTGARDGRAVYGLHGRQFMQWLLQLAHVRDKHVVFIGHLEAVTDDFNRPIDYQVQLEGSKVPREIGAIVDGYFVMDFLKFDGSDEPKRAFVCTSPNRWNYPSKDRSGRLDQIEEPHLGKLLSKILRKSDSTPQA